MSDSQTDFAGLLYSVGTRTVELKFVPGLTIDEIAAISGAAVATVGRPWRFARSGRGMRRGAEAAAS